MVQRTRAWRRRKARTVMTKIEETREWIAYALRPGEPASKPYQAQKLRSRRRLDHDLQEAAKAA